MNTARTGSIAAALLGAASFYGAACGSSGAGTGTGGGSTSSSASGSTASSSSGAPGPAVPIFLILMENHNWTDIKGSASAPYINQLLTMGAHAEQYFNPPGNHPSEPNYIWLEAGTNFGVADDNPPSANSQTSTAHLVNQLEAAGRTWKSYQEDISGTDCPLVDVNNYAPKHNPMVFFQDVTNDNASTAPRCIAHVRPYPELASDLSSGKVADYNFITPNLCDDMHNSCAPLNDQVKQGDTWLSQELPKILTSNAYKNGAIVLITWDESELGDFPIGMIALSNTAKVGYTSSTHYTHSSTLRTVQKNFGLSPFLGDAANATDLSDLFTAPP